MTDTSTETPIVDQLIYLDPNTIAVHPNVRHDLGDLADLTRSVKAIGVRVPTVVMRGEDDRYLLLYGQRRHAAAMTAPRWAQPGGVRLAGPRGSVGSAVQVSRGGQWGWRGGGLAWSPLCRGVVISR